MVGKTTSRISPSTFLCSPEIHSVNYSPRVRSIRVLPVAAVAVLFALAVSACGDAPVSPADPVSAATADSAAVAAGPATALAVSRTTSSRPTTTHTAAARSTTPTRKATSVPATTGDQVTAVGDSVMVATEPNLEALLPGIAIDAVVGRGVDEGLTALAGYADSGELRDRIVVELGTNSPFSVEQFDKLVQIVDGRRFVVVTNHCDRCSWTDANNLMLHKNCHATATCSLADWEATARQNPQFFAEDGIHVAQGGEGAQALTELIVTALG